MAREKDILDFCLFYFKVYATKIAFRIVKFAINGEDHDTQSEGIFNDWICFYLNKELDVDELKLNGITNIDYDEGVLSINGEKYLVEYGEFTYFVDDFNADLEMSAANVMKHFIEWLMENLGTL